MRPTFDGRVLIIEDEPGIADALTIALDLEGFATEVAVTGRAGLECLEKDARGFVILDLGLPDQTGFDVLRSIRQKYNLPVLILTARTEEIDRILGLELGADDYVTKPFSPREVVSRIKAILRRWGADSGESVQGAHSGESRPAAQSESTESRTAPGNHSFNSDPNAAAAENPPGPGAMVGNPGSEEFRKLPVKSGGGQGGYGDFQWDDAEMIVYFRETPLALSPYEYGTLRLLLSRPGMVFSREAIMDRVWNEPEESFDRAVDTVIKNIRSQIRKVAQGEDPIETRRGLGYCIRK